jgi:prolipoprotein diacylglyceryltransferase
MYGLLIALGILVAVLTAEQLAKKDGLGEKTLWNGAFWAVLAGIIGARIYHIIDYWNYYSLDPNKIISIWDGGMGILGGITAGTAALVIYLLKEKEHALKWLDIAGTVLPIGQSIGRWGNYFNNELIPYSIYESLLDLTLFIILLNIRRKFSHISGIAFSAYLLGYGLIRLFLENIRIRSWEINGINIAQSISVIAIFLGIIIISKKLYEKNKT